MPRKKTRLDFTNLNPSELAVLIDGGSEEAARYACELLINHLWVGTPIPYEFQFRLSIGLNKFIYERQCVDLLNTNTSSRYMLLNRKFKIRPDGKKVRIPEPPVSPKGRKQSDLDENIKIFKAVNESRIKLGRLRDSPRQKGAFSDVAEQYHLSPRAIESRYYSIKNAFEDICNAIKN